MTTINYLTNVDELKQQIDEIDDFLDDLEQTEPDLRIAKLEGEYDSLDFTCYLCGTEIKYCANRKKNSLEICCCCIEVSILAPDEFMERLNQLRHLMGWDQQDDH